jgi:hypothetical protein
MEIQSQPGQFLIPEYSLLPQKQKLPLSVRGEWQTRTSIVVQNHQN